MARDKEENRATSEVRKATISSPRASEPAPTLPGIQRRLDTFFWPDLLKSIDLQAFRTQLNKSISQQKVAAFLSSQLGSGPHPTFAKWGDYRLKLLDSFNIAPDVERLERVGIKKETLAIALMAINLSPMFDHTFGEVFGDKKTRDRHAKALLAPIPILKIFAESLGDIQKQLPQNRFPDPAKLISDLSLFSFLVISGEKVYEFLGTNSILETSKFALASLVRTITGRYLDREVSALTGAALQKENYDETSHRVWRIRNYKRLEKTIPIVTVALTALNDVLSQP